jgi:hypothetical protein
MKELGQLLKKRKGFVQATWDDKSIFYAFVRVIKEEYGNQGVKNLVPVYLKNKKLFVKSESSNWKNELWASKNVIVEKMNEELNSEQILDIKVE